MKRKLSFALSLLLILLMVPTLTASSSPYSPEAESTLMLSKTEKEPGGRCVCNYKRFFYAPYNFNCEVCKECANKDYTYEQYACKQGECTNTDRCLNLLTGEYQPCNTCKWGYGYDNGESMFVPYQGDCHWYGSNGQCSFTLDCLENYPSPERDKSYYFLTQEIRRIK